MTKEQFQQSMRELYLDAKEGQLAESKAEFLELYEEVKDHDAELATHLNQINLAMLQLEEYVISRFES